jgi:hypothetical protein
MDAAVWRGLGEPGRADTQPDGLTLARDTEMASLQADSQATGTTICIEPG